MIGSTDAPGAPAVSREPLPGAAQRVTAPLERRLLTVTALEPIGSYRLLRLSDPAGPAPAPGQFAMLAATERWGGGEDERPYLPRAFSICRWRAGEGEYLLEDLGPGTRRLCELRPGEGVWVLGPLGRPYSVALPETPARAPDEASGRYPRARVLVGGGAGIAPLVILNDTLLAHAGVGPPIVLLGFRDAQHAAAAALIEGARVTTENGSVGTRGLCTELLREVLHEHPGACVHACGPVGMLETVRSLCAEHDVSAELALEAPMACGFGACHGCVVPRRDGGYLRTCLDGPVVDAALLAPLGAPAAGALAEAP